MNKYNIKWLGVSLIVVVGGTIIYLYKSNNKKEVVIEKPMISYTSYYNLTDVPEPVTYTHLTLPTILRV